MTLISDLEDVEKTALHCIQKKGINSRSFLFCCGRKYENIVNIYF